MKRKRNIFILIIIGLLAIGSILFIIMNTKNKPILKEEIKNDTVDKVATNETLEFFNAISGVKAENI